MRAKRGRFLAGVRADWKNMRLYSRDDLCRLDIIVSVILLSILFFTCLHGDMRMTGNRSFLMYEHFTDFYEASHEMTGRYDANYLPSTFWAFAIWNLPLYLLRHVPESVMTNSYLNNMWYKLLTVILYYISSHLIYKIGMEVGFGEKKSRLCKFAFLVFPIAVFSEFIFSQYDVFTVFFMMLGLYFYVKGKLWKFALAFGVAITFKYHALLYFLVLLVLREKKIRNLIRYAVIVAVPFLLEYLPNRNSVGFYRGVMKFGMLQNVQNLFNVNFLTSINLVAVACAFVLVWAYQKKTENLEELFSWGMFFATAMSFAVFAFSSWNPQWLLLIVPYLVLNIFMNKNGNLLVMVTNILIVALYIFSSQNLVDERVLHNGILKYFVDTSNCPVRMWDVYAFHNEELLCSAIWVVLLVYVVFGHPRYHEYRGSAVSPGLLWQIRAAFLVGVFAYAVPMAICVASVLQGGVVFYDNSRSSFEGDNIVMLSQEPVRQEFIADGDQLKNVQVRVYSLERSGFSNIHIALKDKETGEVLYETTKGAENFTNNSALYSVLKGPVEVEEGKSYILEFTGDADTGKGIGLYCITAHSTAEILEPTAQKPGTNRLNMRVTGVQ